MRCFIRSLLLVARVTPALLMMLPGLGEAASFVLPTGSDTVIGQTEKVVVGHDDTMLDIGRAHGVGYEEMVAANPGVDPWVPGVGREVMVPTRYVLPDAPREGIVVSLAEHRLYYYPQPKAGEPAMVLTYPISVGRMDWNTPLGLTRVIDKRTRPIWYPPESVRKEHAADGRPLPKAVPPGPDNPLGEYAMRLAIPGGAYLIHGTNKPEGVGMQVTHGCIRMYPEDIEKFFKMVAVNTPVRIIHQPYKMGWLGNELYIEVHVPLEGAQGAAERSLTDITRLLVAATQDRAVPIDWARAEDAFTRASGIPVPVMLATATSQIAGSTP
ncbi:MAG TPA: L,D-transpeptidase family protein [Steroidobacteraceae bacterium]